MDTSSSKGSPVIDNSQIFERNVEDPYILTKTTSSNLSRHASHTNLLLQRKTSTASNNTNYKPRYVSTSNLNALSPQYTNSSISTTNSLSQLTTTTTNNGDYVLPNHNSMDHHHNLENFVPPALDAGCSIVTDKDTNLDDIDMIYSKRPSTIGLNMALGRTRTNSLSPSNQANRRPSLASSSSEADLPTTSRNLRQTVSSSSPPSAHPRLLRFYSYVDMLSDENLNQNQNTNTNQMHSTNNVRPSLLSHYSSNSTYSPRLHLSPTSSVKTQFNNPFFNPIAATNSATTTNRAGPHRNSILLRRYSSGASNSPIETIDNTPMNTDKLMSLRKSLSSMNKNHHNRTQHSSSPNIMKNSKFHFDSSSSSEDLTSDDSDNEQQQQLQQPLDEDQQFKECIDGLTLEDDENNTDPLTSTHTILSQPFIPSRSGSNHQQEISPILVPQPHPGLQTLTSSPNTITTNDFSSTLYRPKTLSFSESLNHHHHHHQSLFPIQTTEDTTTTTTTSPHNDEFDENLQTEKLTDILRRRVNNASRNTNIIDGDHIDDCKGDITNSNSNSDSTITAINSNKS
ncbi:hypothetical protein NCAS_0B06600 [Naumovozyma castellii]|uniref:Uncharacterized protein n=1 Tax=Naumovozyma castellii TaxID=27288 RepID=G0V9X7_NAUCA|nr:hypothetical protein NCAS_0B06600 [Naumovozyma castellii CBS 4309]CCC68744.1 hypothetical protein NCAS_0B06600 [Naumovozyma castellii CBS 4309]